MTLISVPSLAAVLIPLVVLVTTMFGPGLLQTSPMPYISIALTLGYLDRLGPWSRASIFPTLYLILAIGVGSGFAYAGMLQMGDEWSTADMGPAFAIGIGAGILQVLAFITHLAWQRRFLPQERFQDGARALLATLVAPAVWVALFTVVYAVSPIGSYGSIAYSQYQFEPLVQWASVSGIFGIEFLVVWAAVIIHRCWSRYARNESHLIDDAKSWAALETPSSSPLQEQAPTFQHRSPSSRSSKRRLVRRILFAPTPTFLLVFLFVFIYGSMRFWNATGTFFQKPLTRTMIPTVRTSCVIGNDGDNNMPQYLNQTHDLAQTGSKIIIWSETATRVKNTLERDELWATARNISQTYGIILGITYAQALEDRLGWTRNMYTLFDEQGNVLFEYQKANPVAMVETTVQAGPQVLPVADTKYGRLGGAICFDLDFPNFMAQGGQQEVDILLQPSWTWGSIGRLEAVMQSFRAVENGFTLFRCGSWAPSTAYDPYRQLLGYKENLGEGTFTAEVPLRRNVKTIYSIFGNTWGYICCAFAILAVILVLLPQRKLEDLSAKVQSAVGRRSRREGSEQTLPEHGDQAA
ncbi:hypothetical protein BGZ93_007159 [Podila epicladia]|nr:hypothetical protein BGZ92_007828 [Podila epicladia]KAG0094477.1 hypothetical protein BGZ93_007159 [Podila epicladia]